MFTVFSFTHRQYIRDKITIPRVTTVYLPVRRCSSNPVIPSRERVLSQRMHPRRVRKQLSFDDGPDYNDDDDDNNDTDVKYATVKKTEMAKTGKRLGRPPRNTTTKKDSETKINASEYSQCSKDGEEKHETKKRRRFKKESSDESSESDTVSNCGDQRKSSGKRTRDERLFSYISEFICHICPERVEFERFHHANQHYHEVHQEPAYLKCTKCDRKCFSSGGFINHMETHDDPEKNKCPICGKVTDQRITLKKHMRAHSLQMEETLPFSCSQCPRRFGLEKARDKHERLHERKFVVKREKGRDEVLITFYKKISCDICDEEKNDHITYDNFWDLKNHMNSEHNKTPYLKCPICFKKNICRQQLIVHIDVHENPDKYRCDICGEVYQFLEKHKFKDHEREAETVLKSYSCEHCGKMFRCEGNLKYHIDCVHGVKDVVCDVCKKSFSKKAISAHKRLVHSDKMFMCEQCPKMFKNRNGLELHKSEHDIELRKPVKCELCGKEMRRGSSLAKHMKVIHSQEDPVNCNLCGKQFRTKFHMIRHRTNTCSAMIDSRPFKCEICGKGFAMRLTMTEHMTTHTKTSLYQCPFCFKTFGYISNLHKHRKKAHPEEWQEVQTRPKLLVPL
ncbi:zinc finger protein ZFP2-like isoform X2 [Toxorhynchites rutilus septentrionalis]|uniref:zinc finger protein ZFP2-like isoform X2 n=1 Tax=Toxorhynchites rutilus septentrionalis TaxID=329112 RepID=UPI00247B083C|nr:zinc finger protein ZFP2-like isoform X2 [Toxorhynchites rutilus septentrionalis]